MVGPACAGRFGLLLIGPGHAGGTGRSAAAALAAALVVLGGVDTGGSRRSTVDARTAASEAPASPTFLREVRGLVQVASATGNPSGPARGEAGAWPGVS